MNRRSQTHSEHALSKQQANQLAQLLQSTRDRLVRNALTGLELSMNRNTDVGRDSIDESTEEGLMSTALRLRDREKKLLGKIEYALARLHEGEINECEDCGGPIGYRRLQVRPVTTLCIACKEVREAHEEAVESSNKGAATGLPARVGKGASEKDGL
jgi:DnaK suppressor protein